MTVALLGTAACDRPPSDAAAREWTPQDHDHADERNKVLSGNASGPRAPRGDSGASKADEGRALVELTWQKQCSLCHGPEGRGDGPQGAMLKVRDLTGADWQSQTSDEAMAQTITSGKGAMPKFDLPPEIVRGLVARIRATGAQGR